MAILTLMASMAFAASNQSIVYQGRVTRPDGSTINSGNLTFTLSIYSPSPSSCLLYSETQTVNMNDSQGLFSVNIGTGARTDSGSHSFNQVFVNGSTLSGLTCATGSSYTSGTTDDRSLSVSFDDNGTPVAFDPINIKSSPFAMQAHEIDGWGLNNLVKVSTVGSPTTFTTTEMANMKLLAAPGPCANGEILKWNGSAWACAADSTGGASVDAAYGTKGIVAFATDAATSGINITSGTASVNAGTGANQIVKLDGSAKLPAIDGSALTNLNSGNFSTAVPISKGGTGQTTQAAGFNALSPLTSKGDLIVSDGTNNIRLPIGSNGQILSVDSTQNSGLKWAGLSASQISAGTLPINRGGTGTSTFAANSVIVADSFGVSLQSLHCAAGEILKFDASGIPACGTDNGATGNEFLNGGNSFASNASLGTNTNFDLSFKTNGTAKMTVTSTGNVGIGTTAPADTLDVRGLISGGSYPGVHHNTLDMSSNTDANATIRFNMDFGSNPSSLLVSKQSIVGTGDAFFQAIPNTGGYGVFETWNGSGTVVQTGNATPIYLSTNRTKRMMIDANGNVGIGTNVTSVGAPLEVKGAFRMLGSTSGFVGFQPAATAGTTVYTLPSADGSLGQFLKTDGAGNLSWGTASGGSSSDATYTSKGLVQFNSDASTSGILLTSGIAMVNSGTAANQIVKLDSLSRLPAVDGSQVLNLNANLVSTGTLAITRGGTGNGSFAGNGVVVSNLTGLQLQTLNCSNGQIIKFDSSGYAVCSSDSTVGATEFVNGGNNFGGNASLGTTLANSLSFRTNGVDRVAIDPSGNVAIGTSVVGSGQLLEVNGNVRIGSQTTRSISTSRGQMAQGSTYSTIVNAATTVDWNRGNMQELNTFVCDGVKTITFANIQDGATYSLLLSGGGNHAGSCLFGATGYIFQTPGGNVAPVSGRNVVFTFAVYSNIVVYSMADNLQ